MAKSPPKRWRRAVALALAVATFGPAAAQPIEGAYRRNGNDADRMTVRRHESGRLAIRIETLGAAGQSCEVDELLELRGTAARFIDIENAARDWSISFEGERATIFYVGTHPWYCGPQANFRGVWQRR